MLYDALYETVRSGGAVMLPILLVGALGFYLLLLTYAEIRPDLYRRDFRSLVEKVRALLAAGKGHEAETLLKSSKGIVAEGLRLTVHHRHLSEAALRSVLAERLSSRIVLMDRHLPFIATLAGAAPLLGLLGTVTGMVHTFDVITLYGNSNPILLADGISQALITTQSGLLIAFPLLLLRHRLGDRIAWVSSQTELGVTALLNQLYLSSGTGKEAQA